MLPLTAENLTSLPEGLPRPAYDRAALRTGIVHFGVGGFHRAHQAMYLDRLMTVTDSEFGTFKLVRNGVNFSETPVDLRLRPPKLGEHTAETLQALGYKDGEIENLRQKKTI